MKVFKNKNISLISVLKFIQECFGTFASSAYDTDITKKRSGSSTIPFIAMFTEKKTINKRNVSEMMFFQLYCL